MQAEDIFQSKSTGKALNSTNILLSFQSARENLQSVQEDSWTLHIYRWKFTIQNMIIFDTLHIPPAGEIARCHDEENVFVLGL